MRNEAIVVNAVMILVVNVMAAFVIGVALDVIFELSSGLPCSSQSSLGGDVPRRGGRVRETARSSSQSLRGRGVPYRGIAVRPRQPVVSLRRERGSI